MTFPRFTSEITNRVQPPRWTDTLCFFYQYVLCPKHMKSRGATRAPSPPPPATFCSLLHTLNTGSPLKTLRGRSGWVKSRPLWTQTVACTSFFAQGNIGPLLLSKWGVKGDLLHHGKIISAFDSVRGEGVQRVAGRIHQPYCLIASGNLGQRARLFSKSATGVACYNKNRK